MSVPLLASRSQLRALHIEAGQAGDTAAVQLCESAIAGDADAWTRCTAIIVEALGNDDLGLDTVVAVADMLGLGYAWAGHERVIVTSDDWRIHAAMDDRFSDESAIYWRAEPAAAGREPEDGKWHELADIEVTLRAFGGAQ